MINAPSDMILLTPATPIPIADFRAEFLAQYEPPLASVASRGKMRLILDLVEALGVTSTDHLDVDLVLRLIASRPPAQSPYTTRGLLANLRVVCYAAEARRYLAISPFRARKLSKWTGRIAPPPGRRHQSLEEIRRLLGALKANTEGKPSGWPLWRARRLYALTATVAYTALRAKEAQCLWVADVDLAGGVINLVPRTESGRLKTDASAQPLVMPRALVPIVADWQRHRLDAPNKGFEMPPSVPWMFPGSARRSPWTGGPSGHRPIDALKAVAHQAGLADVSFQSLRRSWATAAEGLGVPQAMITRQCRHASEETTKKWYQQRDMDSLHGAVDGFDF